MRKFLPGTIAALVTAGVSVFSASNPAIGFSLVILVLLVSGIVLSKPSVRRVILIVCGVLAIVGASSVFVEDVASSVFVDGVVVGFILRSVGIALILIAAVGESRAPVRLRGPAHWQMLLLVPLGVFIGAATLPHGLLGEALSYGGALVLLGGLLYTVPRIAGNTLWLGVSIAVVLILVVSLLLGFVDPSQAIEGGRLRGLLENANSLGFIAFAAVALAIFGSDHMKLRLVLAGTAIATLVWTGSRASLLAVLLVLACWLLARNWVAGAFFFAFAWLLSDWILNTIARINPQVGLLLREDNSRVSSWNTAVSDWQSNPVFGLGLGQETSIIASSQLRALAQGGTVGFLAICAMCVALLVVSLATTRAGAVFAFAAVCHSFFEGWLLSPVAPLLLVFVVVWCALTAQGLENRAAVTTILIGRERNSRSAGARAQTLATYGRW